MPYAIAGKPHAPAVPAGSITNWSHAGSQQAAALDGPVKYSILEFVRMCALLTFCGTLLIIVVGTLAYEWKLKFTKTIMDRLAHLEAAYELVKTYAAAQKAELVQLRLENEHLTDALELLDNRATTQKIQAVQLQLDNEQLKGLVRTLTLTNEDQQACSRRAEEKTAAVKTQNVGLADKIMALRRQVFQLEQEKRQQKVLLQRQVDIKTLVKENTNAIRALDKRVNSKGTDPSGSDSGQSCECFTPFSQSRNISSTTRSIAHARQLQHVIRSILVGDCSIESTLSTFFSLPSRSRSCSPTSGDTNTSRVSVDELLEKNLEARIYTIKDFVYALDLAREQFRSQSNTSPCVSEGSRRFDSATCLGMPTEIGCC
ncbi:hypothetical protein DPSP01_011589 [Paraphaeosphaeria sporulosa]